MWLQQESSFLHFSILREERVSTFLILFLLHRDDDDDDGVL